MILIISQLPAVEHILIHFTLNKESLTYQPNCMPSFLSYTYPLQSPKKRVYSRREKLTFINRDPSKSKEAVSGY
jgi:hypothetical protein